MDDVKPFIYPGDDGSKLKPGSRYENFIGGDWTKPKTGNYFENISPTSGKVICEIPRSNADDVILDISLVRSELKRELLEILMECNLVVVTPLKG